MPSPTLLSPDLLRTCDAIELPVDGDVVEGRASRSDAYRIFVTRSLKETVDRLRELIENAKVGVITDETVVRLHGDAFLGALRDAGIEPDVYTAPSGEEHKNLTEAVNLWNWLAASSLGRRDVIVTFGGGVINDMGGWAASGYMRGMPYINVATTLVGQVDAAIGGKLAVNHEEAKNLIGGFHQPLGVVSNVAFLTTLDDRHVRAGLAETIKKALIASPAYWDFIETNAEALVAKDLGALEQLVVAAGAIKAELIERDPYEVDSRRTLGFGHALAHPLETVTGYRTVLHGEAVAFGMVVECRIAAARGLLADDELDRIIGLLKKVELPTSVQELQGPVDGEALIHATEKIRLARGGALRWVLPLGLGETVIADDVTEQELRRALVGAGMKVGHS